MPTLLALASTTSGLYRDLQSGRVYQRDELLASGPAAILLRQVRIEKRAPGVYTLYLDSDDSQLFELWSRRRSKRSLTSAALRIGQDEPST